MMSPNEREAMSEAEQSDTLGARAEAKSVKWRHMHCVTPVGSGTQPPPVKLCFMLSLLERVSAAYEYGRERWEHTSCNSACWAATAGRRPRR